MGLLNKSGFMNCILILALGSAVAIWLSFNDIPFSNMEFVLGLFLLLSSFIVLWKITGMNFLRGESRVEDISLMLLLIVIVLLPTKSSYLLLYGFAIFSLAILRLYYMYTFKYDVKSNSEASRGLDYLMNSDKFDGEYIDDVPVKEDLFNIDPFISSLAARISAVNASTSNVLGLVGPWGSGKTTALRLAIMKCTCKYDLIEFDAWSDIGGRSAIIDLMEAIVVKTPGVSKHSPSMRGFVRSLTSSGNFWISLSGAVLDSSLRDNSNLLRSEINAALIKNDRHLLIVIDNLDRASEDTIKDLMAALNGPFRIANTTFVLLYDAENMTKLAEPAFFDKVIVHPIYMPHISPYQYRMTMYAILSKIIPASVEPASLKNTIDQISLLISTPRDFVITLNIILGISRQPYRYFCFQEMVAVRFIEHFN